MALMESNQSSRTFPCTVTGGDNKDFETDGPIITQVQKLTVFDFI